MIKKLLYICEVFIIGAILFMAGNIFSFTNTPPSSFEISLFDLQNKYSEKIQKNLEDFLEPIVGAGNVKAFAQIKLSNNTQKVWQKNPTSPNQMMLITSNQGIVLDRQNVSLILNTTSSVSQNIFKDLVINALGIQPEKGDSLSIQILPFKEIAPLTFGLSALTLIRLAGILMALLFFSFILLMILYFKENKSNEPSLLTGNSSLSPFPEEQSNWDYLTSLSPSQIRILLSHISKRTLVSALQLAPLKIHQIIAKVLPVSIWNELLVLYKQTPYLYDKSLTCQKEIEKTYQELLQNKTL